MRARVGSDLSARLTRWPGVVSNVASSRRVDAVVTLTERDADILVRSIRDHRSRSSPSRARLGADPSTLWGRRHRPRSCSSEDSVIHPTLTRLIVSPRPSSRGSGAVRRCRAPARRRGTATRCRRPGGTLSEWSAMSRRSSHTSIRLPSSWRRFAWAVACESRFWTHSSRQGDRRVNEGGGGAGRRGPGASPNRGRRR